jgi:putative tricarboxylic transport membrane protein
VIVELAKNHIVKQLLGMIAVLIMAASVEAAEWKPQRPIELVVPVQGGASIDQAARALQQIWQERKMINVPVTVVNKPGAGQSLAAIYVHQAAGDPHRIHLVGSTLLTNHIMGRSVLKHSDFTILGQLFTEYMAVSVRAESPIKTGSELVSRMKLAPAALSVAVGSARGTTSHFALAIPLKRAGVDIKSMRTVVFASGPESITNVIGGHVDVVAGTLGAADPHWRAGRLRILAVTSPKRLSGDLSEIPTWREQGIDVAVSNWRFLIAPPGLSEDQIAFWDDLFRRTVALPEWIKVVEKYQWVDDYVSSRNGRKYLDEEYAEQREILTEIGLAK